VMKKTKKKVKMKKSSKLISPNKKDTRRIPLMKTKKKKKTTI